ncbi:MAG TPA: metallophosphoesterase [Acetobacteraceae bacterium]|nr:metallophosphoesterase [Acetobacteraceae bacterium]
MLEPIRLFVASDLHLEFASFEPLLDQRPDLVVLAGDIALGAEGMHWARTHFPGIPTLVTIGNHEAYGDLLKLTIAECRAAVGPDLYFLENDAVVLSLKGRSVRVLGTCLWSDFNLLGADRQLESMHLAERVMADYKLIDHRGRRLRAADTLSFHQAAVAWLEQTLSTPHAGPTVVVTHHAPSIRSVPPMFKASLLSPAFNSDLEPLIFSHQPELWIHGHTHWSVDYALGRTRVYSNQRGYPRQDCGFTMGCISL